MNQANESYAFPLKPFDDARAIKVMMRDVQVNSWLARQLSDGEKRPQERSMQQACTSKLQASSIFIRTRPLARDRPYKSLYRPAGQQGQMANRMNRREL
jgi:hypothetical protein